MGQEAWRVAGFPFPFGFTLYQNAAEPFEGGTIALAMGNTVDPPTSTSFSCITFKIENHPLKNS